MTVHDLLDRYMMAVEVRQRYAESLRRTVRKLEGSGLGLVCQLEPDAVNRFLASLALSDTTRHNIRRELLTLWRFAYDEGLTEVYPARIRKIRQSHLPPETWAMPTLAGMLAAAQQDETPISSRVSLRRCDVLPAWIGLAYESGLRFGDVHGMHKRNIRNGCVAIVAAKTGKPLVRAITPATQARAERLAGISPDGTLFKWALPRRRAFQMWRDFLDGHGFGGSSKWLRRACATQKHLAERGSATDFLQHSDPKLAYRHYIDISQAGMPTPPPPIERDPRGLGSSSESAALGSC
jgi:integrase